MHFLYIIFTFILLNFPFRPALTNYGSNEYTNVQKSKEDLLEWINENKSRFQVPKGDAVFWAGKRRMAAEKWAKMNGKFTKEMTEGGKLVESRLNSLDHGIYSDNDAIWDTVSKYFAELASGDVHVFSTGTTRRINSAGESPAWFRIEKPILMCNQNVQSIYRMKKSGEMSKWEIYKNKKGNCHRKELIEIYGNERNVPDNLQNWK